MQLEGNFGGLNTLIQKHLNSMQKMDPSKYDDSDLVSRLIALTKLPRKDQVSSEEEIALWQVPETRQHIIGQGKLSADQIRSLDKLAEASADTEAEQSARDAAARFESGVRLQEDENN